jgi:mannose-6-phosphate isomerase-like protein (cupin superfamily)
MARDALCRRSLARDIHGGGRQYCVPYPARPDEDRSMAQPGPLNLATTYLRLRPDNSAEPLPVDDQFWPRLMSGKLGNFHRECLVTMNSFDATWKSWEMHPNGDEIVCLVSGKVSMVLEIDGREAIAELESAGDYVRVPRGTWHTARTDTKCTMLFITPGEGTQHRPS